MKMKLSDFNRKQLTVSSGMNYSYIDQAPPAGIDTRETVLCFHGFPDFSYGWRYQIQELTQRGYRVIVPDQAGCGDTDKPVGELKFYTILAAVNAAVEILKHENINDQVVVLGHDWGGLIAWRFLQYRSAQVKAIAVLCTPPSPAGQQGQKEPDIDFIISRIPTFGYQKWFQTPEADATIDPNSREFMMMAYWNIWSGAWKPDDGVWSHEGNLEKMINETIPKLQAADVPSSELQEYVDTFTNGGMRGPLSWYKTRVLNFHDEVDNHLPVTFPPRVPCLMLAATNDGALPLEMSDPAKLAPLFPDNNLERKVMESSDHWLLQDPRIRHKVVKTVGDWVDARCGHQKTSMHVEAPISGKVNVSVVA
ncbi:epoxide hydrolase [Melampsora larici-populina 98AG31]|uniref:Epoxide hydrolase n=1 Tax=Melampsora larici-populina (strain 98AG31 / pathotype 3-4-7) TaxID=747676 RepID=F4R5Y2_MELLP|nr:epoxide hydrolase [Melampsora larici-populina 98AG31]EGG12119.1 epoxide hydrolase [Melampsora larici-populina 98AG31]